ncbi:MAG: DUF86 domain-containing protein [Candidatus Thorarchaeota archaeon]|nr:DUF86 domain-containing protein [Candidatus Thorarchaeota archaeon]
MSRIDGAYLARKITKELGRSISMMTMDRSRVARYGEKVRHITLSLREVASVMPSPRGIVLKGVYYDILTAIESCMDIIAMLCRDRGTVPKGDVENIESLSRLGVIDEALAEQLRRCNGLRNVLVHQYNGIDSGIVLESVPQVEQALLRFLDVVERLLNEGR